MTISELKAGMTDVDLEAELTKKGEEREVITKYGKHLRVSNSEVSDETGSIALSLWGDAIEAVDMGDKVRISKAMVNEYKGKLQLALGKFGTIKRVIVGQNGEDIDTQV